MAEGINLLGLASKAFQTVHNSGSHREAAAPTFILSNCIWKGGELQQHLREPFDMIALASTEARMPAGPAGPNLEAKKELAPQVGLESTVKRSFNNMQVSG